MKKLMLLTIIGLSATFANAQWQQTNGPFGGSVHSIVSDGINIFAGTSGGGVFLSTNNGSSWSAVNNGLTNTYVMSFNISGTNIFAGTDGGGVWIRPLSEVVGIEENRDNAPSMLYPNPSNGKFKIEIDNKGTNKINLGIYSLFGKKIFAITNFKQQISDEIDLSNSPKGIYFVKVHDGTTIYNEKIELQ